jgi:hypothetical protein
MDHIWKHVVVNPCWLMGGRCLGQEQTLRYRLNPPRLNSAEVSLLYFFDETQLVIPLKQCAIAEQVALTLDLESFECGRSYLRSPSV